MSDAVAGVGAVFTRDSVAIAEIRNITGPGMTRDFIDVTNLDSTGGYREFIGGFRDGGELTFTMNFTIDGYGALLVDYESDTAQSYELILPDSGATVFSFSGYVTNLPLNITPDDAMTCDVTIKITGEVSMAS